jgi:hypothetical protein
MIRANVQNMLGIKSELLDQWKEIAQTAIRNYRVVRTSQAVTELLQDSLKPSFNHQVVSGKYQCPDSAGCMPWVGNSWVPRARGSIFKR